MHPPILSRNRAFWSVWTGQAISRLGTSVSTVALLVAVHDRNGGGAVLGALLLARTLPSLLGPLVGVVSDRVDRRWVMISSDLASAALIGSLAAVTYLPALFVIVALLGFAASVFVPAVKASIPRLVREEDLPAANSYSNIAWTGSIFLGFIIGGALVAAVGVEAAFLLDAASFLVSAALVANIQPLVPGAAPAEGGLRAFSRDLIAGLAFVVRQRVTFTVTTTGALLILFASSVNPVQVMLAKDVLGTGDLGYGLMNAAWAAGMLAGALTLVAARGKADIRLVFLTSVLVAGFSLGGTGLAAGLVVAMLFLALGGVANGLNNVSIDTLLQRAVPDRLRGRVFSAFFTLIAVAESAASMGGGLIADAFSVRAVYLVAAVGLLLTWAFATAQMALAERRGEMGAEVTALVED